MKSTWWKAARGQVKREGANQIIEIEDTDMPDAPDDASVAQVSTAPAVRKNTPLPSQVRNVKTPSRAVASAGAKSASAAAAADIVELNDDDFGEVDGDYINPIDAARAAMHPPSEEQERIVAALANGNVAVDAVAGSGKTTTVQHIALRYPVSILLLTYNAKLKLETRERAVGLGIKNLEVHTYHSFCVKYIDGSCHRDSAITAFIYDDNGNVQFDEINTPSYDIVIIDEAQDMTPLYYDIARIAMHGTKSPKIVVLGDRNQSIYGFMGADTRFITLAEQIYGASPHRWSRHSLTTSYRVTRQVAAFVNALTSIGNEDAPVMRAVKDGPKPVYMWSTKSEIAEVIAKRAKDDPEGVFVLAASVKQRANHPYAPIINTLVKRGILVHVPSSDDSPTDINVAKGKVVFSTFHQSKGLERKHVFVLGFDSTQTRDDSSYLHCSNEMYVACTRSLETLTVWHDKSTLGHDRRPIGPLPYLPATLLGDTCLYQPCIPACAIMPINDLKTNRYYESVTELLRHMPDIYLTEALKHADLIPINDAGALIDIPSVVPQIIASQAGRQRVIYEEVSSVTGTTVAAAHEIVKKGECTIQKCIDRAQGVGKKASAVDTRESSDVPDPLNAEKLLRTTVAYDAYITRLNNSKNQIRQFDWINREQMALCVKRLCSTIPETTGIYEDVVLLPGFDPRVVKSVREQTGTRPDSVHGRSDIVVEGRLYEIKAVKTLSGTHVAQLLMYYYGYLCSGKRYSMYLYNVLTDELCKIEISDANLLYAMKVLNHAKNHAAQAENDDVFLAKLRADGTFDNVEARIAKCTKCTGRFERLPNVVPGEQ